MDFGVAKNIVLQCGSQRKPRNSFWSECFGALYNVGGTVRDSTLSLYYLFNTAKESEHEMLTIDTVHDQCTSLGLSI